jgi:ribosomal protein L11 methyltransferase
VVVPRDRVEEAIAAMIELFPEGFGEEIRGDVAELFAFTDEAGARRLRESFGEATTVSVPPGWDEEWKRFHDPVVIGTLWIGPPWEEPPAGLTAVVIDPGRAFGTGGHATTRLCLELLTELDRASVLDLGCGSGVLAIAAAKLGFAPVFALDSDPAAVEATFRNALHNEVEVQTRQADALIEPLSGADIVLANIDLATLNALAAGLDCSLAITSGYYESDRPALSGFRHLDRRTGQHWAADLFVRE